MSDKIIMPNVDSYIIKYLLKQDSIWWYQYNHNIIQPHAILTSGLHSDLYVNCRPITENNEILYKLLHDYLNILPIEHNINIVIGPETGGKSIALQLSKILLTEFGYMSKDLKLYIPEEKDKHDKKSILIVDDVFTTGKSVFLTIDKLNENNYFNNIIPYIYVLVNRSGLHQIVYKNIEFQIISIMDIPSKIWEPLNCPLCLNDKSQPLKPKDNWNLFKEALHEN